jgi:predicted translin family RNA/ssDNA-binding protein
MVPAYNPFNAVINDLQANRAKWKKLTGKKSAMERIYKDLGNMLYGKVVSGISNKEGYNTRLLEMKKLKCNNLTNPIIGS